MEEPLSCSSIGWVSGEIERCSGRLRYTNSFLWLLALSSTFGLYLFGVLSELFLLFYGPRTEAGRELVDKTKF
jgi:hypothetical protein